MPKFLDAPQWYTSSGTLVDMGTPGTGVAGKYFGTNSTGTIGYYNNQIASLNETVPSGAVIYAPTSRGSSGQILTSNGSGAPSWTNLYVHHVIISVTNLEVSSSRTVSVHICGDIVNTRAESYGTGQPADIMEVLYYWDVDDSDVSLGGNYLLASGTVKITGTSSGVFPVVGMIYSLSDGGAYVTYVDTSTRSLYRQEFYGPNFHTIMPTIEDCVRPLV